MGKLLGILLIGSAILVGVIGFDELRWAMANQGQRFAILIEKDIEQMKSKNVLPDAWNYLASVEFQSTTPISREWLDQAVPDISTIPNGQFRLEVATTDWQEGEQYGGIAQFSLVDLKSGNKVWELGRTYKMGPDSSPIRILEEESAANSSSYQ